MNLDFSKPEKVGIPIKQVCTFHSLAFNYLQQDLLCHVVNGHPAMVSLIDLQTKKVVFQQPLHGVESSWQLILFQNALYIAGTGDVNCYGHLYLLNLDTLELKDIGVVAHGEKFLWSLTTDNERFIYIGTWPNGKIISYDTFLQNFTDLGTIVPGQNYLRSLTYLNGFLYAGVGPQGSLVRIDPSSYQKTGLKTCLEEGVPALLGLKENRLPFCYELASCDPYILAFFNTEKSDLLAYNTKTCVWQHLASGYKGMMVKENQGAVLYTTKTGLYRFLAKKGEPELLSPSFNSGFKGGGLVNNHLYAVFFNGSILDYNLENGLAKIDPSPAEGQATQIQCLHKGPDANLYFSAYPGGTGAKYNPKTNKFDRFPLEQAEGMGNLGQDIYFGIYPHARLYKLDTNKLLDKSTSPLQVWQLGNNQDRPFVITSGNGLIYIGTIPDYGRLGGGISIFNPKLENGTTYSPIIEDQSIAALLYHEGILYGGTTIYGGLGIKPSQKHALMFAWDIEKEQLQEAFLPLNAAKNAPMISGFCLVNGLIFGAFNGYIFAYDPVSKKTVKYRHIYPQVESYGVWRPIFTHLGRNGLLYSSLGGYLTAIDPDTLEYQTLARTDLFALGNDKYIYYAQGFELYKIKQNHV